MTTAAARYTVTVNGETVATYGARQRIAATKDACARWAASGHQDHVTIVTRDGVLFDAEPVARTRSGRLAVR